LRKKWATTVEAEMIEGKHFRSTEARRRSVADAIGRYSGAKRWLVAEGNVRR
jgi:hypothetical protein